MKFESKKYFFLISRENSILEAIENLKFDLNQHPLFYNPFLSKSLYSKELVYQIKNKITEFYSPDCGDLYEIPYDFLSNRNAIDIPFEDLIIRYLIQSIIKEDSNICISDANQNKYKLNLALQICKTKSLNLFKIDINNYYESIEHDILLKCIAQELKLPFESEFIGFIRNNIEVIYRNKKKQILRKKKGLCIGLKPDEYFANFLMYKIVEILKQNIQEDIFFIADEVFFFSKDLNSARSTFNQIEYIFNEHNLYINKAKNTDIILEIQELNSEKKLCLEQIENKINYQSSSIEIPRFSWKIYLNNKKSNYQIKEEISKDNYVISTYDDSIKFLKSLNEDKLNINIYQQKHPSQKHLIPQGPSSPETYIDFKNLAFKIYDIENVKKLVKIIYRFPKSQYFSFLAIDVLVFVAKVYRLYDGDFFQTESDEVKFRDFKSEASVYANISIIEMLKSNNIHDFQKYLILRCLFKNKENLEFSFENYNIDSQQVYDIDNPEYDYFRNELPFKQLMISQINILKDTTDNYALKMISRYLIENINNSF